MYTTPLPELSQVWRPLHQYEWTVWEEREELRHPHSLGFPKVLANGQEFSIAKNGSTQRNRALYAAPSVVVLDTETLFASPQPTGNKITIDFSAGETARAEDFFADGILYVKDHTGKGLSFPIEGSEAITATSTKAVIAIKGEIFADDDGNSVLDRTSDVTVVSSIWRNMGVGGENDAFGGIPLDEVSPDAYFWLQKKGPAVATAGAVVAASAALTPAPNGRLIAAVAGQPIVAYALEAAGAAGDVIAVYLIG